MPPLQRALRFRSPVVGNSLPSDLTVKRLRRRERGLYGLSFANEAGVIAHARLHLFADGLGVTGALRRQGAENGADAGFNQTVPGLRNRTCCAGRDMLGAAQTEHLARIERRAAWARDAMRSRGFADGVATGKAAAAP